MAEKTDIELIALARKGNKDAFGLLAQRYQMPMQRFAMRLTGEVESVPDLVQETMLQAYVSLGNLRHPVRFKSWLYGIMLNVCRNHLREKYVPLFSLEAIIQGLHYYPAPLYETPPTPEQLAEEKERYRIVFDAVNVLPAADRDAILLFYYAQLSLLEIVNILNVPLNTVKVRLHRARRRLKMILQERHPEIVPVGKRRKIMVKVTIADVVKMEPKEDQDQMTIPYIVILHDEEGRRVMPIWVENPYGGGIAVMLSGVNLYGMREREKEEGFSSSILQCINARMEEVDIVTLKKHTFYAVVKVRIGKKTYEIDASPGSAIATAIGYNLPIFVAEEVLETAGRKIPKTFKGSLSHKGLDKITKEYEEFQRRYLEGMAKAGQKYQQTYERTPEEIAKANDEAIAALFSK